MAHPGGVDVLAYERGVTASLDRDVEAVMAQGRDFDQRLHAHAAAWQPVPPQLLHAWADGLAAWVTRFHQYGPAAEWLKGRGRPAVGERLAAIIDDLRKAVPRYRQMANEQVASSRAMDKATIAANRETAAMWAGINRERAVAADRRSAAVRGVL